MRQAIVALCLALVFQIGLIVFFQIKGQSRHGFDNLPLLAIDNKKLEQLRIIDGQGNHILLQRNEGDWVLPEYFNFPATEASLQALVKKLSAIKADWPVATTTAALKRFKLAEDNYERKLNFYQNGQLIETLYIGSSPGFRKVHVRKQADTNIYTAELSVFDAPVAAQDWFDYEALKIDVDKISAIDLEGFLLTLGDKGWHSDSLTEKERIDTHTLRDWLTQLAALRFDDIAGLKAPTEEGRQILSLSLKDKDITFTVFENAQRAAVIVKRNDFPFYMRLSLAQAAPLLTIQRSQLVRPEGVTVLEPGVSITLGDDAESVRSLKEMLNAPTPLIENHQSEK